MVGVISSEKKKHPGWMSINQFNLFLKKKNIWMNVNQSIHKGNFFSEFFSCLSLLVSFLNMIKQTVLVICWFAEDRFEYKEVWCLRETLLTVNWNFDVQNTNVWRALHVLKGDGCLFHVCIHGIIQQSFVSIDLILW